MIATGLRKGKAQAANLIHWLHTLPKGKRIAVWMIGIGIAFYIVGILLLCGRALSPFPILGALAGVVLVFLVLIFGARKLSSKGIFVAAQREPADHRVFLKYSLLSLAVLGVYWLIFFPGGIDFDNFAQWHQVQTEQINDWHPAIHTMIIWCLTRVINHPGFVIFVQITAFSAVVGYLCSSLVSWRFPRWCVNLTAAFLVFNPATPNTLMYAWKDCAFAIFVLLCIVQIIHIFLSKGGWLKKPLHILAFSVCLALAALLRHNGILFAFPVLAILLIVYWRRILPVLLVCVLTVGMWAGVRGPLYDALDVSPPDERFAEMVGLPMAMMGQVMRQAPESLTPETKAFLNTIASDYEWARYYETGNWNKIKFQFTGNDAIMQVDEKEFLRMALDTFKANPSECLQAVSELTRLVWQPFGDVSWYVTPEIYENREVHPYSFSQISFLEPLRNELAGMTKVTRSLPFSCLWSPGFFILALLLAAFFLASRRGWRPFLLILPVLAYDFGTMLLLCGPDYRFFFFNGLIALPLILAFFSKQTQPEACEGEAGSIGSTQV